MALAEPLPQGLAPLSSPPPTPARHHTSANSTGSLRGPPAIYSGLQTILVTRTTNFAKPYAERALGQTLGF